MTTAEHDTADHDERTSPQATPNPKDGPLGEDYVRFISTLAAEIADRKAFRRENVSRALIGVVVGAVAFLGYNSISTMKNDLKREITTETQALISSSVKAVYENRKGEFLKDVLTRTQSEMKAQTAFLQFTVLTDELRRREEGFSPDEREAALSLLEGAIKSSEIARKKEFALSVEHLIDVFFQADLVEDLEDLDDILGDVMLKSRGIVLTMVSQYGLRVTGEVEVTKELEERFRKYERAAKSFGDDATVLPYSIGFSYRQAGLVRNEITTEYFKSAREITDNEDQRHLVELIRTLATAGSYDDTTADLRRSGELFAALISDYEGEISAIEELLDGGAVDDLLEGLTPEELLQRFLRELEESRSVNERTMILHG